MLKKAGIKIKDDGRSGLMHNKFWIFDGQIVWTGSTNVTVNCNFRNNNNVIVIESPELAAIYEREFEEMWAGKFGPTSPSTVDEQKIKIKSTEVEVYFASEDETISHLIPLVQSAQKSIRFMAFSYTHDKLMEAMLERQKAGVDVRGIFETRGSETEFSALRPMYCAKIPVRQDGNPATFHHKVIVIDNKILITGSLNFSANADETNDENTIVLFNAKVAAKYIQEFERRWAEAVEPDPAKMKCK
jgi:phosphatidylserine/phosphatidylglycerophosphate/cardiolipin synthase-like enzyme